MKRLLLLLFLWPMLIFGANPSYDAFIGTNGIVVTTNPPQGRVIIDGRNLSNLWTNEPAGRIHPIEFTNRVELQRVLVIGTNYASYAGPVNSNDFLFAYRDITKGEQWGPRFEIGVFSNSIVSTFFVSLNHNSAALDLTETDEGGNNSIITMAAFSGPASPTFALLRTNGTQSFAVSGTNTTIHNVQYTFPQAQGAAGTVLTNNGAGILGWGAGGGGGGGGDSLWTNEPSGRIHPIEFTNRVELQRSLTIGTNSEALVGGIGTNDLIVAIRDITKAEGYSPKVRFGVQSNTVFSTISANLLRDEASWSFSQRSESTHIGTAVFGVDASGPKLTMVTTNVPPTVLFGVNGETNITFNGIVYSFPPAQGAAATVLTNDGAGNLGWGSPTAGGGNVSFGDLVWTNHSGTLKPLAFPTNILFNVAAADNGTSTNFYFDSRVYRTNASSKLFAIYNGGSNAVTVGPHGGLFMGRNNQTPSPGVTLSGIYDTAIGETNQQEIFVMSRNSTVGYLGAVDLLVDTNYGAIIMTAQNGGGTRFSRWAIQAGAGENPEAFGTFTMQALVDNATYFQVDPNFTLLTPTNYLFSSSVRITNIHTLLSLQNSNFPVLEVDGVGDLRMIKKIPYLWPSAQGAAGTVLTNNGSGVLGWGAAVAGGGVAFSDLVWTNTGVMIVPVSTAARALRQGFTNDGTRWAVTNVGALSVAFGSNNAAGGFASSILGGTANAISTNTFYSVIVGGDRNVLNGSSGGRNFLGGGQQNFMDPGASNSVIVGGRNNRIYSDIFEAVLGGGSDNQIRNNYGVVVGGTGNDARSTETIVVGGDNNIAGDDLGSTDVGAVIVGGSQNIASAAWMFIGGGMGNGTGAGDAATNGVISGGLGNFIASIHSTISGGALNTIGNLASAGVIAGGFTNIIDTVSSTDFAFISGGVSNRILSAPMAGIVGFFQTNTMGKSILIGSHPKDNVRVSETNLHLPGDQTILMTNNAGS